jgi:DNA polymerase-3 subunit gamma/tau
MAYIALYRAYRPQTFNEVAGQKPIIQTLKNAIKMAARRSELL